MLTGLPFEELADELADSRDDLLLVAAALELMPENQTKWARFVRLVELAHVIGPSVGKARVSMSLLRRILASSPIAGPTEQATADRDRLLANYSPAVVR